MDTKSSSAVEPEEWEIVLTRVFDLPRELVFKAWTGPKHLAQWWGPKGFTNPLCELDVRPGGSIRIHMCGPDGILYPMTGVYQEIMEPVRLVFTSAALDKEGNPILELLNTVTFAEHSGKTTLTTKARVVKTTPEGAPYLEGSEAGWTQSLERLGNLLASTYSTRRRKLTQRTEDPASSADREIAATRVINAPRELVFRMWTDPEQVAQWWGPNGFTNTIYEMAVRPGGVWRFVMHGPDGVAAPVPSGQSELLYQVRHFHSFLWSGGGYDISVASDSQSGFASDYNLFYTTGSGQLALWQTPHCANTSFPLAASPFPANIAGEAISNATEQVKSLNLFIF